MISRLGANVYCRKRTPSVVGTVTPTGGGLPNTAIADAATCR